MTDSRYQVRGPCPDGDWFVVEVEGDDECAVEEHFPSQAAAQAAADSLNGAIA